MEFNDLEALERALAHGDVAAILVEPALTNIGIVLPDDGYNEGVRELATRYGALLINDETHTICAGPGGYTRAHDLHPDLLVIGKSIGGGIPCGTFGFTAEVADRIARSVELEDIDVGGIGGTLAGNGLLDGGDEGDPRAGHDADGLRAHGAARRRVGRRGAGRHRRRRAPTGT